MSTLFDPGCGMNDLPTEIKARIVELCAEQDERYKEEAKKQALWPSQYESVTAYSLEGRSIGAIFQVSKEFSLLAAPHLFKLLKASRADIIFKCLIRRRLHLFTELHLDADDPDKLIDVVAAVPDLVNLRSLHVGQVAVESLWDGRVTLDAFQTFFPPAQQAAFAFGRASSIKELHCKALSVASIGAFTQTFHHLTSLDLHLSGEMSLYSGRLIDVVRGASNLTSLSIVTGSELYSTGSIFVTAPADLRQLPPLRRLSIETSLLHQDRLSFAACFAATVEHLIFRTTCSYQPPPRSKPTFTGKVFHKVVHFAFSCYKEVIAETVGSVSPTLFPAPEVVELDLYEPESWEGLALIPSSLSAFPLLQTIRIPNLHALSRGSVLAVQALATDHELTLQGASSSRLSSDDDDYGSSSLATNNILSTLAYLEETVRKADEAGDEDRLDMIEGVLEPFEHEKLRKKIWKAV